MNTIAHPNILLDALENGVMIINEEGIIYYWNRWLEVNTGYDNDEICGKKLQDIYPQIDYSVMRRKIRTTLRLNTPTFYDTTFQNRFILIKRMNVSASRLPYMQLQVTISPYLAEDKMVMIAVYDISSMYELKIAMQEQRDQTEKLNRELQQDKAIIDANLMILKADCSYVIVDVTDGFQRFMGYAKEELLGRPLSAFYMADNSTEHQQIQEKLRQKKRWSGEVEIERKSGKTVWMDTVISPYVDANEEVVSYTVIFHDITDKKRIELLSITDPLTKLFNRQKFNEVFEMMLMRRHWQEGNSFALVIADVDFFKKVNDTYGHQVGDSVLIHVGEILTRTIRTGDILARWGGEEFVILLPDVNSEKACFVAEKFRHALEEAVFSEVGSITASFGVTLFSEGDTEESMLYRADIALYRAKKNGRNRVELA